MSFTDEIQRLREYIEMDATCPCCQQKVICEKGCTFHEDAPSDYVRMIYARVTLHPITEE